MPAPTTSDAFLALVRKSGLVEENRLEGYVSRLREQRLFPQEPGKLAGFMVRDGLLSYFQSAQLVLGKWRGFTLGSYKVLEQIGSGGMGNVYLCEHMVMRRRVAIKILPLNLVSDPVALGRFQREARAAAVLDHPHIVRAHDYCQEGHLHFLVMEYVDGVSLQDMVQRSGPLDPIRAAHYIRQAALGLQHAHDVAGLVHRDIKPGNILVDRCGTVKILDMGLARFAHDRHDELAVRDEDQCVVGTVDYLAPEQAMSCHTADIRADIYGLGATFYYLLAGHPPFDKGSVAQKIIWHQMRQPRPIREIRPEMPEELAKVVEKMLAKEPAMRYQLPAEVADTLETWTRAPVPPPADSELRRLSPAVRPVEDRTPTAISPTTVVAIADDAKTAQR